MTKKIHLLIIDPQNGFAKEVGDPNSPDRGFAEQQAAMDGELCIPGGMEALGNVAKLIQDNPGPIDDITITHDCHQELHIATPVWFRWPSPPADTFIKVDGVDRPTSLPVDVRGQTQQSPAPFSTCIEQDGKIVNGVLDGTGNFVPIGEVNCTHLGFTSWTVRYLKSLRDGDRYPHMIWPPHCRINTPSYLAVDSIRDAIRFWELDQFAVANKVTKGSSLKTEHFGAVHAEVPDPKDPSTQINSHFVQLLSDPDRQVAICGLALGHCLANTVRDTAAQFPSPEDFINRLILLEDGTASVPGLRFLSDAFLSEFTTAPYNMQVMKCHELFA